MGAIGVGDAEGSQHPMRSPIVASRSCCKLTAALSRAVMLSSGCTICDRSAVQDVLHVEQVARVTQAAHIHFAIRAGSFCEALSRSACCAAHMSARHFVPRIALSHRAPPQAAAAGLGNHNEHV